MSEDTIIVDASIFPPSISTNVHCRSSAVIEWNVSLDNSTRPDMMKNKLHSRDSVKERVSVEKWRDAEKSSSPSTMKCPDEEEEEKEEEEEEKE